MDELREQAGRLVTPMMIALASVIVRLLFDDEAPRPMRIVRLLGIGLFVGGITGAVVDPMNIPVGYKGGIVGVSALVAEDVIAVIVQAGGALRRDPISALKALINIKRGK